MTVAPSMSLEAGGQVAYTDGEKQKALFQFIFEGLEGFLAIVSIDRKQGKKKLVTEKFYKYPDNVEDAVRFINQNKLQRDMYYCPHLLDSEVRQKEYAINCSALWADVDDLPPEDLIIEPTVLVESSDNRTQALWKLETPLEPHDAEELNKRIAYYHKDNGMDSSGWDLTQLLRVPFTLNHKYTPPQDVKVLASTPANVYTPKEFDSVYPELQDLLDRDAPELILDPKRLPDIPAEQILRSHQGHLNPRAIRLFEETPQGDWSKALWDLECSLLESGLPLDEAFVVCREAACNKYAREGRPETDLWADLTRAYRYVESKHSPLPPSEKPNYSVSAIAKFSSLLSDEERSVLKTDKSIVEDFIEWAETTGDAAYQYHQAGAFTVLSTLLAGRVTLPTSFATIRPNLWFLILGDTTLTRKSSSMDLAVNLLTEIEPSALLATDGSIEGMLTQLSTRPGRPSLFLRDEFTGLLEMIQKRDYHAGMLEALTKLYDGSYQKRVLKKEEIEIRNPVLNIYAGGIKERTLDLLDERHVTSGFIPRFVFIMAETDLTRMKPVGPPTMEGIAERKAMIQRLRALYKFYKNTEVDSEEHRYTQKEPWEAELTDDAWRRYNLIENKMVTESLDSEQEQLITPCMSRLANTGLKVATLIAATRCVDQEKVIVREQEIVHAFAYVEQWREYTLKVIEGVGAGPQERTLMRVYDYVKSKKQVSRTELMNKFKFYGRKGEEVLSTLEDRGLVAKTRAKSGKTYEYKVVFGIDD